VYFSFAVAPFLFPEDCNALKYLVEFQKLAEMGYEPANIQEALLFNDIDFERAMEYLLK
jgi:hypothetical protein